MSFRTIYIASACKLSYKNNHMLIRKDELQMIHLSEIDTIVLDSLEIVITTYLLSELIKHKVNIIFCNEKHNPTGQIESLYGCHNASKMLARQISWSEESRSEVWTEVVKKKIDNQKLILERFSKNVEAEMLNVYKQNVAINDSTNREGHSAKVYFNALFGSEFSRANGFGKSAMLDYGYAIIMSVVSREIVANGYSTMLGIGHKNEFNHFNLSCDLVEPLRQYVDEFVAMIDLEIMTSETKHQLVDILNSKVKQSGTTQFLTNAIRIYVKSVLDAICENDVSLIQWCEV